MSSQTAGQQKTRLAQRTLERIWYQGGAGASLLKPLEYLYRFLAFANQQGGLRQQVTHPVPVIVVGNISIGGTGKTPLVIYLAELLKQAGYRPGIITRGYGGQAIQWPVEVTADSHPTEVGDEPVLMAQRTQVPVVAGPKRNADIDMLLKHYPVNVIISDDGLQHYQLKRDIEIAVIDGERGFGNEHCLPAGPLREPKQRLNTCDYVIVNETRPTATLSMQLSVTRLYHLKSAAKEPLSDWQGREVHAVTGIGNPNRFFTMLERLGLQIIAHAFPDHHAFSAPDIQFGDDVPVLMTEKDAVKCRHFASNEHWFVPVQTEVTDAFANRILKQLSTIELNKK